MKIGRYASAKIRCSKMIWSLIRKKRSFICILVLDDPCLSKFMRHPVYNRVLNGAASQSWNRPTAARSGGGLQLPVVVFSHIDTSYVRSIKGGIPFPLCSFSITPTLPPPYPFYLPSFSSPSFCSSNLTSSSFLLTLCSSFFPGLDDSLARTPIS